jgi:hypothetical protein
MSNTSIVSPYAVGSALAVGAACVIGAAVATIAVAKWLAEESPEDAAVRRRANAVRRKERLSGRAPAELAREAAYIPSVTSVPLHLRDPETLVRAAERLGYRMEPLATASEPLRNQPHVLLRSAAGERLAISRDSTGHVVVQTIGARERVGALIRQHTADRVAEHLATRGMEVRTAVLANGEVQIFAREQPGHGDGAAEIKTQVLADGTAHVDIDKIRGSRCEQIVRQMADAVGGEVCRANKKASYFQLPGEPTKTKVTV